MGSFTKREHFNLNEVIISKTITIHHWNESSWQTYNHFLGYHRHSIEIINCNEAANANIPISDKLILADFIYIHFIISVCIQHCILLFLLLFRNLLLRFLFDLVQIHKALQRSMS